MRLGGTARFFVTVANAEELCHAITWAHEQNIPAICIGGGSNIVWKDEGYNGLVIQNKILGREILHEDNEVIIKVGAGENWDEIVGWTTEKGWSGIELLSLIPGSVGATPVQNVGAYGCEIAQSLVELTACDTQTKQSVVIKNIDCHFGYRTSRFKVIDRGRFFITSITLRLSKQAPKPPFYEGLTKFFEETGRNTFSPQTVRDAVIIIRNNKLPDPKYIANNGSFFANPIIEREHFERLHQTYPDIKGWPQADGHFKLAAAWLIEKAGFRGLYDTETGMSTWPNQALVLVNESASSTTDLLKFKAKIVNKVQDLFQITLEQEPELLP